MPSCGAPGCTNRCSDKKDISFHRLPNANRQEIREKWLNNIKRKVVPNVMFICSEHFEKACFKRDLKAELIPGTKPRNELLKDAVPTIFIHKNLPQKRKTSLERESKSVKKAFVEDAIKSYEEKIESKTKDISCDTTDMIIKKNVSIDNVPKVRSIRTQWKEDSIDGDEFFLFHQAAN